MSRYEHNLNPERYVIGWGERRQTFFALATPNSTHEPRIQVGTIERHFTDLDVFLSFLRSNNFPEVPPQLRSWLAADQQNPAGRKPVPGIFSPWKCVEPEPARKPGVWKAALEGFRAKDTLAQGADICHVELFVSCDGVHGDVSYHFIPATGHSDEKRGNATLIFEGDRVVQVLDTIPMHDKVFAWLRSLGYPLAPTATWSDNTLVEPDVRISDPGEHQFADGEEIAVQIMNCIAFFNGLDPVQQEAVRQVAYFYENDVPVDERLGDPSIELWRFVRDRYVRDVVEPSEKLRQDAQRQLEKLEKLGCCKPDEDGNCTYNIIDEVDYDAKQYGIERIPAVQRVCGKCKSADCMDAGLRQPSFGQHDEDVWSVSFGDIEILVDRVTVGEVEVRVWRNGKEEEYPWALMKFQVDEQSSEVS